MRTQFTGPLSGGDWNAFYDRIGSVGRHKRIPNLKDQMKKMMDANGDGEIQKDDVVKLMSRKASTDGGADKVNEADVRRMAEFMFAGKKELTVEDVQKALSAQRTAQQELKREKEAEQAKTENGGYPRFEKPRGGLNQELNVLA